MNDTSSELLKAVNEIRETLLLIAEPAIAERDAKRRGILRVLVGKSEAKKESIILMDGTRNQVAISKATGMNQGHLSTLIKQLGEAKLLDGEIRLPKLAILIPSNFFDGDGKIN